MEVGVVGTTDLFCIKICKIFVVLENHQLCHNIFENIHVEKSTKRQIVQKIDLEF